MRKDYKVPFRTRESIRTIALRVRDYIGNSVDELVQNVNAYFRKLATEPILKTGLVKIVFIAPGPQEAPAYITYKPTTLHVDKEIWDEAESGEPKARFILAHELGHVLLHDHHAQLFSEEKSGIWREEESSEWQADCFAEELLITESALREFVAPAAVAIYCSVERSVVVRRFGKTLRSSGDACPNCGNFSVVCYGAQERCDVCGKSPMSA